ncbi:phosphatidylserine decarboxylase [Flagellimonas allohymeniacidonis]|uniref:Phosphatidylserine decarboxylase n=1 Tax=Flagellimonas allohymeniacidonis TaxID=2517819 RepID=A0A4Q8QGB4_9FLAO|nr:phosphatidylserine decarboxylase [Allomuricauda hymeniacidonis]TAI48767.1 phosphatidylserine decarboxylase [Allomuricauda hymeniacidonis]
MNSITEYYSDPSFTVFKVPEWRAKFYKFLSVEVWGNLPSNLQRSLSSWYSSVYDKPYSKKIIEPYIRMNYSDKDYLQKFKPPNGKNDFECFQDFFIREFKELPANDSDYVWPCEGLLCDEEKVENLEFVQIKSDVRSVATVFGLSERDIPKNYTFTNVFLHNKNYHRIHSPIDGTITRIQHVPGDLVILRPWIYKQNPSLPAFRNERYNIDITDANNKVWHLSIIGGPAVGTIQLSAGIEIGGEVSKLQELSLFYLGSTCCMAAPISPRFHTKNTFVEVGIPY